MFILGVVLTFLLVDFNFCHRRPQLSSNRPKYLSLSRYNLSSRHLFPNCPLYPYFSKSSSFSSLKLSLGITLYISSQPVEIHKESLFTTASRSSLMGFKTNNFFCSSHPLPFYRGTDDIEFYYINIHQSVLFLGTQYFKMLINFQNNNYCLTLYFSILLPIGETEVS